ncbi:MAG: RraA family protein [Chthoniobacterales bacterium]
MKNSIPPTANINDALSQLGYKFQTMSPSIRPISDVPVRGSAYTVNCYAGATYAVEEAVEKASPGDVLVVYGESYPGGVLMGGLLSRRAKSRGIAGAIIDGAVRDIKEVQKMNWPFYAVHVTPRNGTHDRIGQNQIPISCGGVVVNPGDMIVADSDGVVCIPVGILDEALSTARKIEERENFITEAIDSGLSISEAVEKFNQK